MTETENPGADKNEVERDDASVAADSQTATTDPTGPRATVPSRSYWRIVRKQYSRSASGMIGLIVFLMLVFVALLAPLLANDVPLIARYKGELCFPALPTYLDAMPVPRKIADALKRWQVFGANPLSTKYPDLVNEDVDGQWKRLAPSAQADHELEIKLDGKIFFDGAPARLPAAIEKLRGAQSLHCVRHVGRHKLSDANRDAFAAVRALAIEMRVTERQQFLEGLSWKQAITKAWDSDNDWYLPPPVFFSYKEINKQSIKLSYRAETNWGTEEDPHESTHWIGTDREGRDVLARMIHGTIISLSVGVVAVSIYCTIGVILGLIAGYLGGWIDILLSRITEIVICFPSFFLIITVIAFLEKSIYNIMIVIGLTSWTGIFRLMRGEVLRVKELDYNAACRALGVPAWRVMYRHLLPNTLSPILVSATFGVASAILTENALSFLGFGVASPTASWGEIVGQGRLLVAEGHFHLVLAPGAAIFLTVTVLNLVGQSLRDAMDPRLRH
ncbi:MAG: ABC transporter permease [Planctomycetota bacterium]